MSVQKSEQPPRRIVVVGGVAGGMSAAARARRLEESAEIIVLERGPEVSFANCGLPYYVGGEITDPAALLVQTPESLRAALRLDVRTRHEVTGLDTVRKRLTVRSPHGTCELDYDALVLSPGARAVRPPIPGLDSARVHTLRTVADALTLRDRVDGGARRAVVLGGGFIGLEAAEALVHQGLAVTLVEAAEHVLGVLEPEIAAPVTAELTRLGVDVRAGATAERIVAGGDHDTVHLSDGTVVAADLVVLSVGVTPDTEPFQTGGIATDHGAIVIDEHGRTSAPGVWAVGDAVAMTDPLTGLRRPVALAGPANRAGRQVADDIIRPDTAQPLPVPLGTAIVRVGEVTAAMAGPTRAALAAGGIEVRTIHLHPTQHAGYFPGASPVHLLVHLGTDGRVLAAQASGREGVDRRIDVLATAIRAGMHAADLIDLDLAYSPPFGQAKDAVNLAGMVASNLLDGTLRLWYAEDLAQVRDEALVLDVRSREEFDAGRIAGSINIPHTELRERLDDVRAAACGHPVRVLCGSGVRSAIAHRVLTQAGLDSASLSGGLLTLQARLGDAILTSPTRSALHPAAH